MLQVVTMYTSSTIHYWTQSCAICKALFLLLLLRGMDYFGGICFPWFMVMSIGMYNLTGCEKLYMAF
jgi:hypothetical protein